MSLQYTPLTKNLAAALYRRVVDAPPELPGLYEKQQQFVTSGTHHAAFVAGIGSGKSWAGAVRAMLASKGWIGGKRIKTPNLGVVTAPTYDMLRDATLRTFRDIAGDEIVEFNKNEMVATMRNGSEIIFRSTQHPERLRGPSVSWWWGDEAALYTPLVRKIMVGRLRQFGALGYDWITTTPRGRNWVWQTFVRDAQSEDYLLVKARSRENIYLDSEIVDTWEQEYVGDFAAQELDAEFVAFEGLIYGEFDRARHERAKLPGVYTRYVAGVDWGFANPGVILIGGVDGDGRIGIVHEMYRQRTRIEEWVDAAVQLRDTYQVTAWYCDPSNPDNIKKFIEAGLKAEPANNTVLTGIHAVKARLAAVDGEPRLLVTRDAVNLVDEFESYQWAKNQHGLKDEPLKTHDHAMDALRYLVMGVDYPTRKKVEARTQTYA